MIYQVVSVYDRAADAFGRPVFALALGQAIRSFQDEINRNERDNTMHAHPEDYDLFHLGEFDDATGKFTNLPDIKQLAIGKQMSTTKH